MRLGGNGVIDTRWTLRFASVLVAAGVSMVVCSCGSTKPSTPSLNPAGRFELMGARVVSENGATVYVSAAESLRLEPGSPLVFIDRGREVAAGRLEQVLKGTLAEVTITSGDLPSRVDWDRVRVFSEPRTFTAAPLLRLGYPARFPSRLDCTGRPLPPRGLAETYRTELIGERSWRGVLVVRDQAGSAPWPDTLLIRLFDDSVDEEIAFQRDEIDAAVFGNDGESHFIEEQSRQGLVLNGIPRRWVMTASDGLDVPESVRAPHRSCPIVTPQRLHAYLSALGPDSLVNLLSCEPALSKP